MENKKENKKKSLCTIITPTKGEKKLFDLIETITRQNVSVKHILLWDDERSEDFSDNNNIYALDKKEYVGLCQYEIQNIVLKGNRTIGNATGSQLRSIGLMAADTEFILFADDDVMWENNHLESMLSTISDKNWVFCKRKIWAKVGLGFEYLGVDDFESVGEEAKVPYKMVDNNCMMFKRKYGVSASPLYRETQEYNDDRIFYDFMKKYAGEPSRTLQPTINQVCPDRLVEFFRAGCTK